MATLYEQFEPAIQAPFQRGPWGTAWGAAFGNVKDLHLQRMKQGVLSRFPTFAAPDAIGQIALERQMVQGVNETLAHFVQRLLNPWGVWTEGGTYWGLLAELAAAGYDGIDGHGSVYIAASNGYIYGPGDTVTVPDPVNGLPGNPPGFVRIPPWYSFGSAPASQQWAAHTDYAVNAIVIPIIVTGAFFVCTQGGTSGAIEPTFPGPGGSVSDGTVTWTYGGSYLERPVYPPWNFGGADGQGAPSTLTSYSGTDAIGAGGDASPDGAFWSRFVVIFDPIPTSWSSIENPPTLTSAPGSAEISVIREIIAKLKPAKSTCVGIVGLHGDYTRACWGWPLTTTTNIPNSNWMSRAISAGDVDAEFDFDAQAPQTIESWLANTTFTSGLAFVYMIPSSQWENDNNFPTPKMLFEATGPAVTTGFVEPTWPTVIGDTVTDNGITWTAIATLYRWGDYTDSTVFTF